MKEINDFRLCHFCFFFCQWCKTIHLWKYDNLTFWDKLPSQALVVILSKQSWIALLRYSAERAKNTTFCLNFWQPLWASSSEAERKREREALLGLLVIDHSLAFPLIPIPNCLSFSSNSLLPSFSFFLPLIMMHKVVVKNLGKKLWFFAHSALYLYNAIKCCFNSFTTGVYNDNLSQNVKLSYFQRWMVLHHW